MNIVSKSLKKNGPVSRFDMKIRFELRSTFLPEASSNMPRSKLFFFFGSSFDAAFEAQRENDAPTMSRSRFELPQISLSLVDFLETDGR